MQTKRNQAGFTLIELLVVIAIIGILAAVGIPAYQGFQAKARFNASVENHARAKSYIAAEVTKCNGQTTSLAFTTKAGAAFGTPLTCPVPDAATAATYFQAYVADQMSNPYAPSMAATSAPASGNGLMTVGSDANGNVTLTTVAGPDQGVSTNAVKTLTDTIAVSD